MMQNRAPNFPRRLLLPVRGEEKAFVQRVAVAPNTVLMHKGEQPSLKITLAEHSATGLVVVDGAKKKHVKSASELVNALGDGIASRTVHATKMNSESSRSHLVMAVEIHTVNKRTSATTTGKLTLVDLAGSERVDRSGAVGQQLKEAQVRVRVRIRVRVRLQVTNVGRFFFTASHPLHARPTTPRGSTRASRRSAT